jgi:hypothetical protein
VSTVLRESRAVEVVDVMIAAISSDGIEAALRTMSKQAIQYEDQMKDLEVRFFLSFLVRSHPYSSGKAVREPE